MEAAARQSRFHPRCGTSFLLIVMGTAIVLFSILDAFLIQWLGELTVLIRIGTHLPLIPLVGGISYEFIRWSAKRSDTTHRTLARRPGLWLQKITTKEPDDSQLEVAVVALRCALGEEYTRLPLISRFNVGGAGQLTMLNRLEKVRERYEEVGRLLSDPAVVSNSDKLRELSKEHSDLTPLIKSYERYSKLKKDIAGLKEITETSSDSEMKQLAYDELNEGKEKLVSA